MTWIQKRKSSRPAPSAGPAVPVPEPPPAAAPTIHPTLQRMIAELPNKAYFRPDEVADHFSISVDLVQQFIAAGKLISVQVSHRVRRIPRTSLCDYIRQYVQPD